ncbi:hypothetical protein RvY_00273 [Ramazzottius varieornatus]|uniref:Uncharacterized protein n=1 Tax=Ramazzottius varieornatus TaxID=947166 RepID=A0A1D1UC90_RAMVA|nr:hypothetical protein RvY_00273 [Ramazzottius varieornatus]
MARKLALIFVGLLALSANMPVEGNLVAIMQSMTPFILPFVAPMIEGLQDMVNNNHHTNKALNADHVSAKIAEYAKEFFETMEHKGDKDNDAMELENLYLKFAVGALAVILLLGIFVFAYMVHYLFNKAQRERLHNQDLIIAMRDIKPETA